VPDVSNVAGTAYEFIQYTALYGEFWESMATPTIVPLLLIPEAVEPLISWLFRSYSRDPVQRIAAGINSPRPTMPLAEIAVARVSGALGLGAKAVMPVALVHLKATLTSPPPPSASPTTMVPSALTALA
jgi:hypothetical protein